LLRGYSPGDTCIFLASLYELLALPSTSPPHSPPLCDARGRQREAARRPTHTDTQTYRRCALCKTQVCMCVCVCVLGVGVLFDDLSLPTQPEILVYVWCMCVCVYIYTVYIVCVCVCLCVVLSPNGKYIAVSLLDSTVKVFYEDSLKFFLSLYGHRLPVNTPTTSTQRFSFAFTLKCCPSPPRSSPPRTTSPPHPYPSPIIRSRPTCDLWHTIHKAFCVVQHIWGRQFSMSLARWLRKSLD